MTRGLKPRYIFEYFSTKINRGDINAYIPSVIVHTVTLIIDRVYVYYRFFKAFSIELIRSSRMIGFATKSSAPRFFASTASLRSA